MKNNGNQESDYIKQEGSSTRLLYLPKSIKTERKEQEDRSDEPGVIGAENYCMRDMSNAIHEHQIDGDQSEANVHKICEIKRDSHYSPDARDVDDKAGCRRKNLVPFSNKSIYEKSEFVIIMLLILMEHVDRKEEEYEHERSRPQANEQRRQ